MSRPADRRRFYVGLGAITLVALAWRVFYDIHERGRLLLNGDAAYYHWEANLVAKGYGFIDPGQFMVFGRLTPSAGHPPAYMLYLAGVSRFVGTSELTHRLASTLLGAGAVFMIGLLARRIFSSDWAGWVAAALAAGYAHLWINDEMLMSESMYALTTAIAVWTAYRFWDRPRTRTAAIMGLGIALAAMSRAEAITLFPFLAIPFGFLAARKLAQQRGDGRSSWKLGARWAAAACLAGALFMAPWIAYNITRFEHPVLVSNGVGSVLMVANCDATVPRGEPEAGAYRGTLRGRYVGYWSIFCAADLDERIDAFASPARAAYLKEQLGYIPGATPGSKTSFFGDESTHEVAWRAVGTHEIKDHLSQMPRLAALRVARMWDLFRPGQNIEFNATFEGRGRWQSRLATYQYFPLLALSIAGLVLLRRRRVPILPFLAIAATITITAATTFGITRYRAPVDAMLPVLAGGTLAWAFERVRATLRGPSPTVQLAGQA